MTTSEATTMSDELAQRTEGKRVMIPLTRTTVSAIIGAIVAAFGLGGYMYKIDSSVSSIEQQFVGFREDTKQAMKVAIGQNAEMLRYQDSMFLRHSLLEYEIRDMRRRMGMADTEPYRIR